MEEAILYIHGRGGSAQELEQYREVCAGFELMGVDYSDYLPWLVKGQVRAEYDTAREKYSRISVLANSIGAYFAMNALQDCEIERAMFISPVLDMERLILDMMTWAGVTEQKLAEKGEIPTNFGETLSWEYLSYVRKHPIDWRVRTEILYAQGDELISRKTVDGFAENHNAELTVMENGEHWFHTREQMEFLCEWLRKILKNMQPGLTNEPH